MKILIKYKALLLLLLSFSNFQSWSQEYIYDHFSTKDGLPSSEIYHVFQDSKGYMWFATDNGVSKYNGYEFVNYDTNDGLAENSISEIYEDRKGRIWFIGITGKLSYYSNQNIYGYEYNNKLSTLVPDNPVYLKSNFFIDDNENIYLSIKGLDLFKIDKNGNITAYRDFSVSRNCLSIYDLGDKEKISSIKSKFSEDDKSPFDLLLYKKRNSEKRINITVTDNLYPHHFFTHFINDSTFWMSAGNKIYYIKNYEEKGTIQLDKHVVWMNQLNDKEIVLCPVQEGAIIYFINDSLFNQKNHFLKGYTVTSVLTDNLGAIWFTTSNNGVFMLHPEKFQTLNKNLGLLKNKVTNVEIINDSLYVGYDIGKISLIYKKDIKHINYSKILTSATKSLLFDTKKNHLVVATTDYLYFVDDNKIKTIKKDMPALYRLSNKSFNATSIISDDDGGYWIGGGEGFFHVKYDKVVFDSWINKNFKVRVNSLFLDKKKILWLGCRDGLRKLENGKLKYLGSQYEEQKTRILAIKELNGKLIIATKGKGILIFDGQSINKITKKDGLSSNMITSLAIQKNVLWVGTLNGLNKVILKTKNKDQKVVSITNKLPSFEINQIKVAKNILYLATNYGVVIYNTTLGKDTIAELPFHFTGFTVNGEKQNTKKTYYLKNTQNNIRIKFEALNYKNNARTEYMYQLKGLDENWSFSNKREINYYNLKPGKYEFLAGVNNKQTNLKRPFHKITFVIAPQFWQTLPFKIGISLLTISLLLLIYANRHANTLRKMQFEKKLYSYKLKTLWGQIKPHFLFNTLNSINNYIISNEAISASKYLTKFSSLIRKILEYTQYETISLSEELETLELYMKIEAIRLKHKFEYKITIENEVNTQHIFLPGMVLQPFVENSIWHGIQPLERKGSIKLKVRKKDSNLVVEIIDNGIGLEKNKKTSVKSNAFSRPHGTKIAKERLTLFAEKLNKKSNIEYIELKTNSDVLGTKVRITMPLLLNEKITEP